MTRINANIPVKILSDEHLLAEHREIKRIPDSLKKSIKSGSINKIPQSFKLGAGHVLFFVNKLQFVFNRYKEIHQECLNRKFNVEDFSSNFISISDRIYWNDWKSPPGAALDVLERISIRTIESNKKYFHYYSEKMSKEEYLLKLNNYKNEMV